MLTVVLSYWIERIRSRLCERLTQGDMTLEVKAETVGQWKTDPPAMEQIIFNLIDSAVKYANTASDRRVHLRYTIDNHHVELTVSDHGPSVPTALQQVIFRPFSKSAEQAAETAAGVGLGLA